jgi:phytoene dehydrogenase-like protein
VVLENGDEIAAKVVVSGVDPHRTFLRLVGEEHLEPEFAQQVKRFKMRGSSGKVNLALDALPEFACLPGTGPQLRGDITIAPSIAYLERAYDDAKYGAFSRRPFMDIVIPSLTDPTVAPPGKHTMSIFVQYAPYKLKEGAADWPRQREAFGDAVIDTLAQYMPNLPGRILHRQVLTPWDLEQVYGLTEGNIFHGELSLEQLAFLRPVPGWSRYRTPIGHLWMCASGTHPGGGIMGAPGALCARTMLQARAV